MDKSANLLILHHAEVDQQFTEVTRNPAPFFNILPADWRESIVPFWPQYENTARVFVIQLEGEVAGGGIIFTTNPPDTAYIAEARELFNAGYMYIGFLWVSEKHRGKKLGLEWIHQIRKHYPNQKFWLAIDEYWLKAFYERTGFSVVKEVVVPDGKEWILIDA